MSWIKKQLNFRDLKKIINILEDEVGEKVKDIIIAVDLEDLLEDIIHRVIVECITNDPVIMDRIKDHIQKFMDKLTGDD